MIRPAARADLPDIVRLVRGLAVYERPGDEFTADAADFEALMFGVSLVAEAILAEIPGRPPVGIALFYRTVNTFKGRIGLFLEDLFVEPDQRGKGIGKQLLRHLGQIALDRGGNIIEWRVLNWNEPSIRFYEKLGAEAVTQWHVRQLRGAALISFARGDSTHG